METIYIIKCIKLAPLKSLNAKSCWFTGPKKRYLWVNYI